MPFDQITYADLQEMSPQEINKARADGRLKNLLENGRGDTTIPRQKTRGEFSAKRD